MGLQEPNNSISATEEVMAAAAVSGAPLHIVHLASSGLGAVPQLLQMIEEARSRGLDISTEAYPYTAGMTGIESAIFAEGWQEVLGIDFGDLEWAATSERLTAGTFAQYRDAGGMVILHFIPPEAMEAAITSPFVMIASDGKLEEGRGHPRTAGTYAKVLDDFVAEAGTIGYVDAIRKMSLMPAQRLEGRAPAMARKGRLQVGADADLTIFSPSAVEDRATYGDPAQPPLGIPYVLVNGVPVVFEGEVVEGVTPGKAVRAPVSSDSDGG
jgi:dihydroorotase